MPSEDTCPCHGEPWKVYKSGKRECAVTRRARKRSWARTARGRETNRAAAARWRSSHFRLKAGGLYLGSYPCTAEQKERIQAFRKEQLANG